MPLVVRIVSHLAAWTAVLVPLAVVLSKGWVAVADDAAIAIRSFQAFTLHPPLVGIYSTAGNGPGHYLFDPGPLLFWLVALPAHLDHRHGSLWGAALLGGAVLSLAIEAAWWKGRWEGCALVAFVAVDLLCLIPLVFENLLWNAYFPIPFFVATIVLAWIVTTGSLGWWPPLVFVASVAAQCHLVFAVPSVALALGAPVAGLALGGRPQRLRWLVTGAVVGVACWLAPLAQTLGSNGNLTALARSGGAPTLGTKFGLQMVATASSPWPIWLRSEPTNYFSMLVFVSRNSSAYGLVVLVVLGLIAVIAWRAGYRSLCALGLVALATSISVMITFAIFPEKNGLNLDYLIVILWVVGVLIWTTVGWAAVVAGSVYLRRRAVADLQRRSRGLAVGSGIAAVGVLAVMAVAGATAMRTFVPTEQSVGTNAAGFALVNRIAAQLERTTPCGPVAIKFRVQSTDVLVSLAITEGVAWRLEADGWHPGLYAIERVCSPASYRRRRPRPS